MRGMSIRPILLHPDPRLKKVSDPVGDISDEIKKLADDMLTTMYDAPGIGLAAPQVGVGARLLVMDCAKDEGEPAQPMVLINPEILWTSDETNTHEEGCLSLPDQFADVVRPAEVEVRWLTLEGGEATQRFDGLWATCVQHEIDHLNGTLFIDHLKPLKRQMMTRKAVKKKKELARAS